MILFYIEKVSIGWSFCSCSVIRTSFLSCSCFFLLLVKVEGGKDMGSIGVKDGVEDNKEAEVEEKEERGFFFSFFA